MSAHTITARTKAWFITDSDGPEDLHGDPVRAVSTVSYYAGDMTAYGWSLVGEAEITLYVDHEDTLIDNKVAALRQELKNVLGEAQLKATEIEGRIQKLLAISYTPKGAL